MKKILLLLSLFLIMFLFGCAEQTMMNTTIIVEENIQYKLSEVKFDNIEKDDLIYYVLDEVADFALMIELAIDTNPNEEIGESLNGIIDTLGAISEVSNIAFSTLLDYSATDLNSLAIETEVSLTVDDIVGFYDLTNLLEELSQTKSITKVYYLNTRIGRDLTTEEIHAINYLQEAYSTLRIYSDYTLVDNTFLEIVDDLAGIEYEVTQTELDSMEVGYDLIMSLIEEN